MDEFYHDLSDGLSRDQYEMIDSAHDQVISLCPSVRTVLLSLLLKNTHQRASGDHNERTHSTRQLATSERNHSNGSSRYASSPRQQSSSTASNTNYGRDTQRAILSALTNLQNDVHNILERLNRLETSAALLQQVLIQSSSLIELIVSVLF